MGSDNPGIANGKKTGRGCSYTIDTAGRLTLADIPTVIQQIVGGVGAAECSKD